jgi:hypothetical protein
MKIKLRIVKNGPHRGSIVIYDGGLKERKLLAGSSGGASYLWFTNGSKMLDSDGVRVPDADIEHVAFSDETVNVQADVSAEDERALAIGRQVLLVEDLKQAKLRDSAKVRVLEERLLAAEGELAHLILGDE